MAEQYLFSYGTLQLEAVQMATFGRRLSGTRDLLPRYVMSSIAIEDEATVTLSGKKNHAIARFTGRETDTIDGTVYAVTPGEVLHADKYEVAAYKRVAARLQSGVTAWVYVDARDAPDAS
jgi:hypothetical protein